METQGDYLFAVFMSVEEEKWQFRFGNHTPLSTYHRLQLVLWARSQF